jgi:sterol desaturase/sphingolipid hydroxylase (fatty acid hydroxylase superfamily)
MNAAGAFAYPVGMDMNVYAVLTPLLLLLIAVEFAYCMWRRPEYYNFQDSMANLATAIGNQVINVGVGYFVFKGYGLLQARFAPWTVKTSLASSMFLFLAVDFLFYWFHRAGHTINVLWAAHSPHHSSEELNYTVAARASVTQRLASFAFYAPLALLGFTPEVLIPAILVHHVLQFWPHTRAIEKLPDWFETYFNAPTHHRVHHGANDRYLDKNFGGVLIVWDKLFGTFEPESEPVIYGVRPPLGTWEVLETNFSFYSRLWRQAQAAPYALDKLKLWFMPLGWTPRGLEPRPHGYDPRRQVKYQTRLSDGVKLYMLSQMIPTIALLMLMSHDDSPLSLGEKLAVGSLIWMAIVAWGGFLESAAWAVRLEAARLALAPFILAPIFERLLPGAMGSAAAFGAAALSGGLLWACQNETKALRLRFKIPML